MSHAVEVVHRLVLPLGIVLQLPVDQRPRLVDRPGRQPQGHEGVPVLLAGAEHDHLGVPEGHTQVPARLVEVLVRVEVELELPAVTELQEHLVDVQTALGEVEHRADLRLHTIDGGFLGPGLADLLEAELGEGRLDVVPHVRRHVDDHRLPLVEEDLDERLLGVGSGGDRPVLEPEGREVPPGGC